MSIAGRLMVNVVDSLTSEPIPFAAVTFPGTGGGVLANDRGVAVLFRRGGETRVNASVMGYSGGSVDLQPGDHEVTIRLAPTGVSLQEVTVGRTKERYSKKDNPAVAFVEAIKKAADLTDPRRNPYYNYDEYERFVVGINNFTIDQGDKWLQKDFNFLSEHIDTSEITGNPVLNLAIREKASKIHFRRDPKTERELIMGHQRAGIDDVINNQDNVTEMLSDVFREIDLYSNDITIMQNRFVSPLSKIAPDFYKFYLTDTLEVDGEQCVVLSFVPHNTQMMGFTGRVFVPQGDSTMFIRRVEMRIPRKINLNFIENIYISQQFDKAPDGSRLKTLDDMVVELQLLPKTPGIYVRRNTAYRNHNFKRPADSWVFDEMSEVITSPNATKRDETFWANERQIEISPNEARIDELMKRMRGVKLYYWVEKLVKLLASGYFHIGNPSIVDIGDIGDFLSSNDLEGFRMQVGYVTMAGLSKRFFSRGYVAYAFGDHRWKYRGELEYSFNDKKRHSREFPVHSIKAWHMYDVNEIGQTPTYFSSVDLLFSSFTRMDNNQMTYQRQSGLEYVLELQNNFSIKAAVTHTRQEATALMNFTNGLGQSFGHYNETTLGLTLRYAPGEKFYQGKNNRHPLNLDAPVFTLSHTYAPGGILGSMFTINRTEATFNKRFWLSAFGYIDLAIKGGHIWSRTPYPNLLTPNANITYLIKPESFSLVNPLEFMMDTYGMWDFTYWGNGVVLNHIPLIKKLKMREVISFRGFMGHLSKKNDPAYDSSLFQFPEVSNTQRIGATPYMEVAVGLDNILRFFRVDYVWRLTYRSNPGISRSGIRASIHLTF